MALNTALPASALPFIDGCTMCLGAIGSDDCTRYSVIARASCRVRRISSSLELFSSMKKCGIFVVGRNAFGAQIHVLMNCGESFAVMFVRLGPTFTRPLDMTSDG